MSKISAIRLINLNYNNNAIRISDETFQMNGQSTLLSLRNGGGKSVLVQMIMAPFVHKRYRDAKERPFESYFTTNRPSFILVEWQLDHGAGYVMTGMMVRRRQEISADIHDNLEIIQFISEYRHSCPQDIHHLPVVEKNKKEIVLKNFASCRQLFDFYKKEAGVAFFSYDMSSGVQAKQYFDKLMEYQIYYKEWETIIKKINLKESGLSDLFSDCRDEKGLAEKWLLESAASKINQEKDRIKEFQSIVEKFVCQYKDNKSKIQRRDIIRQFAEESEGILKAAQGCQEAEDELQRQKERIGVFLWQLDAAKASAENKSASLQAAQQELAAGIEHLRYQQVSKAVHEAMEAERHLRAEREIIQLERDEKEREYEQAKRLLHILDCAGRQQELDAQSVERIRYERQLEVLNQKEQDFDAERKSLGYTLRLHYEDEGRKQQEQLAQTVRQLAQIQEQLAAEEERAESLRAVILEKSTLTGSVNARILSYDRKEETYNKRYEPGFLRNILGEYEPAALEIRLQEYEKELDGMKKTYLQMQKEAEEGSWKQKESERNLEDARQKKSRKHSELEHAQETCLRYAKELDERRKILRYFGLDESVLYDMDKILRAAENRLSEIELAKRKLEKEEDQLQKEYQHLTQGRILELPAEFEKLLAELGISYVYGMEWLKKNQYSEKENRRFVHAHPFLPYSLLLSQRDLDKFRQASRNMPYTSFPIPIMIRTQLEQAQDAKPQAVTDLQDVHFYMLFNEHLLNEKKLKQMAADLEQRLAQKKAQVQQRREEYGAYFEKKEQLRSQKVTREQEQLAVQKQEQLAAELCGLSEEIGKQKEEMAQLAARLIKLQQQIQDNVCQQSRQERRLEDLRELEQAYQAYLLDKAQLNALQQELEAAREKEQLSRDTAGKLRERRKKQEIEQEHFLRLAEKLAQKAARYAQYEKTGRVPGDIRELENRYEAITSRISLRQQELERLLQEAGEKERRIGRELERRRKKYQLADGEWKQTAYDAKAEEYQEQLVHSKKQQYELKKAQWNEADKHAALASQRLGQQKNALMEKCRRQQPLPKHEIQPVDFEAEIEKHNYQWRELEKEGQLEQKRIRQYEETMTALAEYAEFMPENEKQLWEFLRPDLDIPAMQRNVEAAGQPEDTDADAGNLPADKTGARAGLAGKLQDASAYKYALEMTAMEQSAMERLSGEELRRKKGMLVRDYNSCQERRQGRKEQLAGLLNQMARREAFAEDFYRKPIEAMLSLLADAGQVIRQLQTTLRSYESLMEKIQVDISVIEQEKERIVELLCEYAYEVHQNLGRMDQNSTIRIRDKTVKMLKITLPDWEEHAPLYLRRIQDFMDETTRRGIELLEHNENAQEYFGVRLTTKSLYDITVGIEHVQIRLYKIEEQREYPITWSQVARNSGGEGFLSAFIILASLLYYMRRDDTDLFAGHNEGKVLLMDNPFAQTNAAHLLKPLMDMAQKTNTQLICLSGLGGESIYSRFDNIYVLNLIAAGLSSGTQYLKAEHMRGSEAETMLVSQIEVLGQQELVF